MSQTSQCGHVYTSATLGISRSTPCSTRLPPRRPWYVRRQKEHSRIEVSAAAASPRTAACRFDANV
eukprot:3848901-Rhodomonas_salina.1